MGLTNTSEQNNMLVLGIPREKEKGNESLFEEILHKTQGEKKITQIQRQRTEMSINIQGK